MSEIRLRPLTFALAAQFFGALSVLAAAPSIAQQASQPTSQPARDLPLLAGTFKAYASDPSPGRMSEFSGLPVPRYASLKSDKVNGRAGPSTDYPVAWAYHQARLPVVIIRESVDWRKIRDPQGDEVWVHRSLLSGERTAITIGQGALRRQPSSRSAPVARFGAGAILRVQACGEGWCEVEADRYRGHVPSSQLWGAEDLPAPRPAP